MISCIIPAAKTEVNNLNLRKFGYTSLLEMKLKNIENLDIQETIISSNDDTIKNFLTKNIKFNKRKESLCVNDIDVNTILKYYCDICQNDIILHSTINYPFIKFNTFKNIIDIWHNNDYDLICVKKKVKGRYFNIKNSIEQYNIDEILLNNCLIFNKKKYLLTNNLFDKKNKIKFIEINEIETFVIKTSLDFIIAESLYYREFNKQKLINNYMLDSNFKKTKILDCTIRDTGYLNNWKWSYEFVKDYVYYMGEIGIEYCEIGFLMDTKYVEDNSGIWRHINSDFSLIKRIKKETNTSTKIAVMLDIGNYNEYYYDFYNIPDQNDTHIDLIRVCCFYQILERTVEVINILSKKGYNLTLNIMYSSHLTKEEINNVKKFIINKPIEYLYFADSIGALCGDEINKFFLNVKSIYPIKNGFHNHDNNGTVFNNVSNLLKYNIDIIDVTLSGLGKNGGNCSLELVIFYMIFKLNYNYNIDKILMFLDKLKDFKLEGLHIDIIKIKNMLQQYLNVHPLHTKKYNNCNLFDYYHNIKYLINHGKWN